ncbi:MAG: tetratricopeptide repeat protein [Planctomycetota bacterium]|jgi:tetratricopeptide (TPR) repeat protein
MRKNIGIILVVLSLISAECFGAEKLANYGNKGLKARSMPEVLLLQNCQVDLGTAVLIASEQWSQTVQGKSLLIELDNMAYEIRARLRAKKIRSDYRAIPIINDYLFNELGFRPVNEITDPEDLFLHRVLENRRGYCLSLAVLYLSIGERLGLNLYGVVVPGHFFVRYDDGQKRFNIETTAGGRSKSDEAYERESNVPDDPDGIYMKNLSKLGTLSCFFNNLGNIYTESGDLDTAKEILETAMDLNPTLGEVRTNLGNIYLRKKMTDEAIRQYRAALEINPQDSRTYNNLGNAYAAKSWYLKAVVQYKKCLELDPNFDQAYRNLSISYLNQGKYAVAAREIKHAISLKPDDAGNYCFLGDIYYSQERYPQARKQYQKALALKSDFAEAYYRLGLCYGKEDQIEQQQRAFENALSIKPDLSDALVGLGNIYFTRKIYNKAIDFYDKALTLLPDDGDILYNIGSAYLNNGDNEEAVEAYIEALGNVRQPGPVHKGLTYAYFRLGKFEKAWEHIQLAADSGIEIDEALQRNIQAQLKQQQSR